jgi:hypothetical protein
MKYWYNDMAELLNPYKDDLEYLLYVGIPFGIVIILLHEHFDFSHLF